MIASSVEQYLSAPFQATLTKELSPVALQRFEKLLTVRSRFYFTKIAYIKALIKTLVQEGVFQPFSFKTVKTFKKQAYMRDGDGLYISYGIFFKTTESIFFSVLCHELAHIWLSQREFYPALKTLNKAYLSRVSDAKTGELTSPIEVYARLFALHIIKQTASFIQNGKRKKKAETARRAEEEKLRKLQKMFDSIEPKTDL